MYEDIEKYFSKSISDMWFREITEKSLQIKLVTVNSETLVCNKCINKIALIEAVVSDYRIKENFDKYSRGEAPLDKKLYKKLLREYLRIAIKLCMDKAEMSINSESFFQLLNQELGNSIFFLTRCI